MKKSTTFLTLLLIIFSLTLTLAAEGTNCTSNTDCEGSEICSSDKCTSKSPQEIKLQEGFDCLEEKAKDCTLLSTQELTLTILATPDNIFDDCVEELEDRKTNDNWVNIQDTALAILALRHAGKDTTPSQEWLLKQTQTPTDLIWYMQEDSNEAVECNIGYKSQDFTINIGEDKKIDIDAGSCLKKSNLDFWLQINKNCYEEEFQIECNKDFIANLLYKNSASDTIYVLDQTASSPAFGPSIDLSVKSKCFGETSCEYEDTLWATLALLATDHDVQEFIPYIIAASETNTRYLPEAFIYILTGYEDYAGDLISKQKLGNYWEPTPTAYNKYYDTALALISLEQSTSEQVTKAKDWLFFSQSSNGCWDNNIRETAIVLWVLSQKEGKTPTDSNETNGTSIADDSVARCTDADYFCVSSSAECSASEDVSDNYFCPSLSSKCCMTENLETCSGLNGQECASSEVCTGNSKKASDTNDCCIGACQQRTEENECEANFYTCMDSCSSLQEPISTYACDQSQVCCKTKTTTSGTEASLTWWIWVLIVLIIAVLVAIGYVYRDKLALYWFQLKTKFKKDDGKTGKGMPPRGPRPGMPPRPGFPPVRRRPSPQAAAPRQQSYNRRDKAMSDTFKKLQDMSR